MDTVLDASNGTRARQEKSSPPALLAFWEDTDAQKATSRFQVKRVGDNRNTWGPGMESTWQRPLRAGVGKDGIVSEDREEVQGPHA